MAVIAGPTTTRQLDADLWAVSPVDFIAHGVVGTAQSALDRAAVLLVRNLTQVDDSRPVLINLDTTVPDGFARFERVIEIVSNDEEDRQSARSRWKHYTAMGYEIKRHDLKLKGANP